MALYVYLAIEVTSPLVRGDNYLSPVVNNLVYIKLPTTRIEVDEYECAKCGHKWISRVNGQDRPKPTRCAKCKNWDWERGYLTAKEDRLQGTIRWLFGYRFKGGMMTNYGWRTEPNALRFLRLRPSIEEMEMVLKLYNDNDDDGHCRKAIEGILEKNGYSSEVIKTGWRNIEEEKKLTREMLQMLNEMRSSLRKQKGA